MLALGPAPRRAHRRAFACDFELILWSKRSVPNQSALRSSTADHSLSSKAPGRRTRVRRSDSRSSSRVPRPMPMQRMHGFDAHSLAVLLTPLAARHTQWDGVVRESDASLEVSSPSAFSGRAALSVAAVPPDDPASAFCRLPTTRASTCLVCNASPVRFYAPRIRCGHARVRTSLPLAVSQIAARSVLSRALRTIRTQVSRSPILRAGESGESEFLALANDPSHQATPLDQSAASCRVMHRRVPWRGVPLPRRKAFAAWPGDGSFPHAFARRRSWGSFV